MSYNQYVDPARVSNIVANITVSCGHCGQEMGDPDYSALECERCVLVWVRSGSGYFTLDIDESLVLQAEVRASESELT